LGVDEGEFAAAWKPVARQSERQLGSFIFTYLSATKKAPKLLPDQKVEFRNKVIHQGRIPSREEAIEYGERVAEIVVPIIKELKTNHEDQVQAAVSRHLDRLRKQVTVPNIATMAISTMISTIRATSEPQPSLREWIEGLRHQRLRLRLAPMR
jgi:hypothetical protein